jgi:hypothetical protein
MGDPKGMCFSKEVCFGIMIQQGLGHEINVSLEVLFD